ncbi:MAG: hypothetical protein MJK11_21040 [Pseudomonadales bacterium]|nr:hypothetical protein [Pseudomonadales bacterium]
MSKISRMKCENLHLGFLKWALGIHRKASNIGTWGETGRYPLIFQSIKLTLNYLKRIENLKDESFVYATFQEQRKLKPPWYCKLEPLLQIDDLYNKDHVTAAATNSKNPETSLGLEHDIKLNNRTKISNFLIHNGFAKIPKNLKSASKFSETSGLTLAKPIASKQFAPAKIFDCLLDFFRRCWTWEKSKSSKLSFYHAIKNDFACEIYLQEITNIDTRANLTKLRVSAHELSTEKGRYKNIPRDDRTCNWCTLTLNSPLIEDENHMLYKCDLYATSRKKLVNNITKHSTHNLTLTNTDDSFDFMTILSLTKQCVNGNNNGQEQLPSDPQSESQRHIRKEIANFINNCFERRSKFLTDSNLLRAF